MESACKCGFTCKYSLPRVGLRIARGSLHYWFLFRTSVKLAYMMFDSLKLLNMQNFSYCFQTFFPNKTKRSLSSVRKQVHPFSTQEVQIGSQMNSLTPRALALAVLVEQVAMRVTQRHFCPKKWDNFVNFLRFWWASHPYFCDTLNCR